MDKLLGVIFLIFAILTIRNGDVFFGQIISHVEGVDRYFYAIPYIFLAIYFFTKKKDVKPKVYKCLKCKEVFCEIDIQDKQCPECSSEMTELKKYYRSYTDDL